MRKSKIIAELRVAADVIVALENTLDVLRAECQRLTDENDAHKVAVRYGLSPDLVSMHIDMVELERETQRVRAINEGLLRQLENVRADLHTSEAIVRARFGGGHA